MIQAHSHGVEAVFHTQGRHLHGSGRAVFHINLVVSNRVIAFEREQASQVLFPALDIEE